MACMQKMRKESGVCGQSPRQARASSAVAEISAACSLSAHTIWRPGEEEEDGKGQKQIVALANKTSRPSCSPGGILEVWHFLPWNRTSLSLTGFLVVGVMGIHMTHLDKGVRKDEHEDKEIVSSLWNVY
ncbi:hypothetical protein DUI87_29313 [Hirundo rustica rustica]|uniref:Uncharacterized protein n=1 Tax=Hirundo rustica rustica TaxID=333673 RepID=A0A3M0J1A8_HIRRU|nr:hypothetical protein DUI87_29313 [Hirundo rustica rustica]